MKRNDTKPFLNAQLKEVSRDPVRADALDLTGATVKFILRATDGTVKVAEDLAGTEYVDRPTGVVRWEWGSSASNTCGEYVASFEVTDTDSYISTYWDNRTAQEVDDEEFPESLFITIVEDFA